MFLLEELGSFHINDTGYDCFHIYILYYFTI